MTAEIQSRAADAALRSGPVGASRARVAARSATTWHRRYKARLLAFDVAAVTAALTLTYIWKFGGEPWFYVGGTNIPYIVAAVAIAVVWIVALGVRETRSVRVLGAGAEEYKRLISASVATFGLIAILSYCAQAELSRLFFVTTLPLGTAFLVITRMLLRQSLVRAREAGRGLVPCIVVGPPDGVIEAVEDLRRHSSSGYTPVGVALTTSEAVLQHDARRRLNDVRIGNLSELRDHLDELPTPCAVVIADGVGRQEVRLLAWSLENSAVELMLVSRLTDVAGPRTSASPVPGANLVHVDLPHYDRLKQAQKRAFDIVVASVALVVLAPVMLLIAGAIRWADRGPALFRHTRIGQHGKPFTMHKFRTMQVDADSKIEQMIEASGGRALLFKVEDDPRVTPLGRVLRKYSLDELPQFWDVFRGDMCIVGPRPQVAREVAEYTGGAHRRLLIKPGITGLWQVNGRSTLAPETAIRLDLRYVENWSLAEDIAIVLRTIKVVLFSRGAY